MQVTPSTALFEAPSELSRSADARPAPKTPRPTAAEEEAAQGNARQAPHQAYLGRYVDISV